MSNSDKIISDLTKKVTASSIVTVLPAAMHGLSFDLTLGNETWSDEIDRIHPVQLKDRNFANTLHAFEHDLCSGTDADIDRLSPLLKATRAYLEALGVELEPPYSA